MTIALIALSTLAIALYAVALFALHEPPIKDDPMLLPRLLRDSRIVTAMDAASDKTGHPFLDILVVVASNLPAIVASINNPVALVALIVSLLAKIPVPVMPPMPEPPIDPPAPPVAA